MAFINQTLRRNIPEILMIVLLGALCLTTINQTHDWGGDFAQYLDNAHDLISGSANENEEVLDGRNFAPITRGAGFSLLLSPILLIFGDHIFYFTFFISCIFLFCTLLIAKFYQKLGLKKALSLVVTLVFVLNLDVFKLKQEVLPTFPFLALLYLIFFNFPEMQIKRLAWLSVLTGIMVSIRNVGWILYLCALVHLFIPWFRNPETAGLFKILGFALVVPLMEMALKWLVFGHSSSENLIWYSNAFYLNDFPELRERTFYYYDQLLIFFKPNFLGGLGLLFGKLMILLILIGWIFRIYQKRWNLSDTFVIGYGLVLLLYEGVSGIRFLIPVLPILLLYWICGFTLMLSKFNETNVYKFKLIFATVVLLTFTPGTWTFIKDARRPIPGPNSPSAQEAFTYVQNTLSDHEATAFHKPWVFHYYTGRTSMAINPKNGKQGLSMNYLVDKMTSFKVNHLLISIDPRDKAIYNEKLIYEIQEDTRFTERWRNDAFVFLSLN